MVERDISQYKYDAMSNKVLQVDRRFVNRVADDATGEAESLAGRISINDMGSRVATSQISSEERKNLKKSQTNSNNRSNRPSRAPGGANSNYIPRTQETGESYDLIMSWASGYLDGQPEDVIQNAVDEILTLLKEDGVKDETKKTNVEDILDIKLEDENFHQILSLSKRLTDFNDAAEAAESARGLTDDAGVAVSFSGDEEDEDGIDEDDIESSDEENASGDENLDLEDNEFGADPLYEEEDSSIRHSTQQPNKPTTVSASGIIPAHEIDAYWLQRQIGHFYSDAHTVQEKASETLRILSSSLSLRQVENDIMELFDMDHFELVELVCRNRERIVWLTRLSQADNDAKRKEIEAQINQNGQSDLLIELHGNGKARQQDTSGVNETSDQIKDENAMDIDSEITRPPRIVDLSLLTFDQGSHLYTGGKLTLPPGSEKHATKTYEQYDIPAPRAHFDPNETIIELDDMPDWTRPAFSGAKSLNRVQSKVYPASFQSDENILLCAPTGAGKTNVALLTMLRTISHFRDDNGNISLDAFKIIYIAPLKALVQEQVREFGKKLESYGITVSELTGDRNLTKQQLSDTQVIVTTPEKWDVITRKSSDVSYTNLVKLIIIDEIHLLHDERGPVIESIIARSIRKEEATGDDVRLVGLSATLPNYKDVARFLRVSPKTGLFYFDSTYRPCPLEQKFIGITEKKAFKRYQAMNDACYDKVMEYAGRHQVIIFVHSRKETAKTAKFLRDKAKEEGTLKNFVRNDSTSREIVRSESEQVQNADLKDVLPFGFAIHHAGLSRADRSSSEDLFREGYVQVLVSTATLAWGVNLPAHTVIIKGTQVYSPEKGRWTELSAQDVLQMLGRAGRPKFDKSGEGIIITAHSELNYYMSLVNAKLPIESQFMSKLADNLNAEIVLGTIRTREDAVQWLGYTYLYVRMLRSPSVYRVGEDYADDKALTLKRLDLVHSALIELENSHLIKYDQKTHIIQATELGRVASHFYISYTSIAKYNQHLKPFLTPIELFRIFTLSEEFKYIPVRQEEKLELAKLMERTPIPIKEGVEEPAAKINVLLQAYISRLKLDGFALMADMVYVTQSAGRLFRAIYEICLRKGWAVLTKTALDLCKMIEKRMWLSNSPLRQFPDCPREVIRKMEASQMPWVKYFDLSDPAEVGQAIRVERAGKQVFDMIHQFPRLSVDAHFQPVTPSLLRVELVVTPQFEWNSDVHGNAETFIVMVEDCDGEAILFSDTLVIRRQYHTEEHLMDFTVPVSEPIPPNYFISVISEKWLHSQTRVALNFKNLILPQKFPAHTPIFDLQPIPVTDLKDPRFIDVFPRLTHFNKIQTQTFHPLFNSDDSILIGAAPGNGKTVCAELSLLRHWNSSDNGGIAVYIAPFQEQVNEKFNKWHEGPISAVDGIKTVVKLTGELSADIKLLENADLVLATPTQWDLLSRRWQKRRKIQNVGLFIADDIHMIGGFNGAVYEIIISRMRYIVAQTEKPMRIVGLSTSLSNGKDLGEWIGASSHSIYNFSPKERQLPLEIHLQSVNIPHHPSLMIAMARPTYYAIRQNSAADGTIVFVSDRQQCIDTSRDLMRLSAADMENTGKFDAFRSVDVAQLEKAANAASDTLLKESITNGIGFLYPSMEEKDRSLVIQLFERKALQVVIASREISWACPNAGLVVVLGTQIYEGREHRYVDYPISELLQMLGRANEPLIGKEFSRAVVLTNASKREYYRKFLNEALPIESHLNLYLHDAFVAEISEEVIQSRQDSIDLLTFSFFYRRLHANPTFYGLIDNSHTGLSEYLSELVENTLKDLSDANLVELDEDEDEDSVTPLNGAVISAYYNISFITMQTFSLSLTSKTRLRSILEIVSSSAEFETIPVRAHEDRILSKLYERVPIKLAEVNYGSPQLKAFVLLQAHFSRISLPPDLASDQTSILEKVLQLLAACVDVLSGEGNLNAMSAMDLSQMVVQAMWDKDSPLKQIPYFDGRAIQRSIDKGIDNVEDFASIEEDEVRETILGFTSTDPRMREVADFVNSYPSIGVSYRLPDEPFIAGEASTIMIDLERDSDFSLDVFCPRYPFSKQEHWWLVIGESSTKQLYAIKRVSISRESMAVKLELTIPDPGDHHLSVWCMSDSYFDADKELELDLSVSPGSPEDPMEE